MTGKDAGGRFIIICIKVKNQIIGSRRGTTNWVGWNRPEIEEDQYFEGTAESELKNVYVYWSAHVEVFSWGEIVLSLVNKNAE